MASNEARLRYDRVAREAPEDFWRQTKRTVRGEAVDEAQIVMAVEMIADGASLEADDVVLDLCCGNGALADRVFDRCRGGLGVDLSAALIAIARTHFERPPLRAYVAQDVEAFLATADPAPFTKAVCSMSFQYFAPATATRVLALLHARFTGIATIFLGDVPDKERMHDFFYPGVYHAGLEDDIESDIGAWRTPDEMRALAAANGWTCEIRYMPATYHAAHYRYNAVLSRR